MLLGRVLINLSEGTLKYVGWTPPVDCVHMRIKRVSYTKSAGVQP